MLMIVSAKVVKQKSIPVPKHVRNAPKRYTEITFLFKIIRNMVKISTDLNFI